MIFNPATNPHLMTRLGINCVFNVGAMEWNGNIVLMARTEGWDRKSFFAVAESKTGVDGFRFWDYPVRMPELEAAGNEPVRHASRPARGRLDLRIILRRAA